MDDNKQKDLSIAIGTDTEKMEMGKKALTDTIGKKQGNIKDSKQIPVSLEKREKDTAEKRGPNNK